MFRQVIQSAINKERLEVSEIPENDRLVPIGPNGEGSPNRLADLVEDSMLIVGKEDSSPSSANQDIVHKVQENSSQHEQELTDPAAQEREVRPVSQRGQTGLTNRSDRSPWSGQTGFDQGA